ncbi:hypothetical protein BZA70DRAFT_269779 [Myxozyma melibiosi]|uniref:Myb/SANT-like domain-containing protein n=1 Tax=Myxozyma melibiosi TaxID=54550 RepID=A0ABR1EZA3_9ASCO
MSNSATTTSQTNLNSPNIRERRFSHHFTSARRALIISDVTPVCTPQHSQHYVHPNTRNIVIVAELLVDELVKQVRSGKSTRGRVKNDTLVAVHAALAPLFTRKYSTALSLKQVKARYTAMRNHYNYILIVKSSTEFEWDERHGRAMADPEPWDVLVKTRPHLAPCIKKRFLFEKEFAELTGKIPSKEKSSIRRLIATGSAASKALLENKERGRYVANGDIARLMELEDAALARVRGQGRRAQKEARKEAREQAAREVREREARQIELARTLARIEAASPEPSTSDDSDSDSEPGSPASARDKSPSISPSQPDPKNPIMYLDDFDSPPSSDLERFGIWRSSDQDTADTSLDDVGVDDNTADTSLNDVEVDDVEVDDVEADDVEVDDAELQSSPLRNTSERLPRTAAEWERALRSPSDTEQDSMWKVLTILTKLLARSEEFTSAWMKEEREARLEFEDDMKDGSLGKWDKEEFKKASESLRKHGYKGRKFARLVLAFTTHPNLQTAYLALDDVAAKELAETTLDSIDDGSLTFR